MDVVMLDMVVVFLGYKGMDYLCIVVLIEVVLVFVFDVLELGGIFVVKVLVGGVENEM